MMTTILTISEPVVLGCADCDSGFYALRGPDYAVCEVCGNDVTPSWDIERFLEWNERMTWVEDGESRLLAYFVEEEEEVSA